MKKVSILLFMLALCVSLAACSDQNNSQSSSEEAFGQSSSLPNENTSQHGSAESNSSQMQQNTQGEQSSEQENQKNNMLVAYFTYGENAPLPDGVDASTSASIQIWDNEITGNTGVVAHMIGELTGAELFSIRTAEQYPTSYDETVDQGQEENSADARPELSTHIEDLEQYDVIFLGFPNWWYDMPMAVYSFLDEYDFAGKTIVPFVTSGGSGFSSAIGTIEDLEPEAVVTEGLSIGARNSTQAQDEISSWLTSLGYLEP